MKEQSHISENKINNSIKQSSSEYVGQRKEATSKGCILTDNRSNFTVQKKENNTGLPDTLKSGIESMSGYSMDDVRVHYNSGKPAQLNAYAYAQGTDIHVASGQEKHLPHEAWHVVQQKQGRVEPTTSFGGTQINDNKSLEKEADVMGGKALQMKVSDTESLKTDWVQGNVAQRIPWGKLAIGVGVVGGLVGLYNYMTRRRDRQNRDTAYQEILAEQAGQPILGGVQHTTQVPGGPVPFSHTVASPGTGGLPQALRTYTVEVNNDDPVGLGRNDPELIRTAEIHERTHLSVDQSYSANSGNSNQHLGHGVPGPALGAHLNQQWELRDNRLTRLQTIVDTDQNLSDQERDDITRRIANARQFIEYDPTVNELLAYTHEYNMNPSSPIVKALVALANESRINRTTPGSQLVGNWPT